VAVGDPVAIDAQPERKAARYGVLAFHGDAVAICPGDRGLGVLRQPVGEIEPSGAVAAEQDHDEDGEQQDAPAVIRRLAICIRHISPGYTVSSCPKGLNLSRIMRYSAMRPFGRTKDAFILCFC